jgi:fimbrial chaperone protein
MTFVAYLRHLVVPLALLALALALLFALPHRAAAQGTGGSILIWPVGPVIENDARAAALWLENPGQVPVTLQVRIYAWAQQDGKNVYAVQDAILGTPPIVTIAPGEKQLVRLTRTAPTAAATEAAYRVVVDEIPAANVSAEAGASVSFRMRYSLPLFAYGQGLVSSDAAAKKKPSSVPEPGTGLDWRTGEDSEGRFVEVRNRGAVHARLTDVAFADPMPAAPAAPSADTHDFGKGLFGYVLPGATMRWPLPPAARVSGTLVAAVNGKAAGPIERRADHDR